MVMTLWNGVFFVVISGLKGVPSHLMQCDMVPRSQRAQTWH
jgi:hypothetical protein